jgi:uncharacterized damage-inducible protein DinB
MPQSCLSRRASAVAILSAIGALIALASGTHAAKAQDVPNRDDAAEWRKQYVEELDSLHSKLAALANAFPDSKYAWRPTEGVRSVGEVFMHVAGEFYVYAPMAVGGTRSPVIANDNESETFEKMATKADVLKHLAASFDYATSVINAMDPAALTGKRHLFGGDYTILETTPAVTDDMHEHLGQLIAYARMNGITPPWSRKM